MSVARTVNVVSEQPPEGKAVRLVADAITQVYSLGALVEFNFRQELMGKKT